MSTPGLLTLVLSLDPISEPLAGRIQIGDEAIDFVGWLEPAAVLDRALARAAAGTVTETASG